MGFVTDRESPFTAKKTSRTEVVTLNGWGTQAWGTSTWGVGETNSITTQINGFVEDSSTPFVVGK